MPEVLLAVLIAAMPIVLVGLLVAASFGLLWLAHLFIRSLPLVFEAFLVFLFNPFAFLTPLAELGRFIASKPISYWFFIASRAVALIVLLPVWGVLAFFGRRPEFDGALQPTLVFSMILLAPVVVLYLVYRWALRKTALQKLPEVTR